MLYAKEWLYAYWRFLRDAVLGGVTRPAPMPMAGELADRAEERAQLFTRLQTLRASHAQAAAARKAEMATLEQELIIAQSKADILRGALAEKQQEHFCASIQFGAEEDRVRAGLAEKISTTLELFLNELTGELERLRHTESFSTPEMKRDYTLVTKHLVLHSNGPSIQRRVRAICAAQEQARQLQYESLTTSELIAELAHLRAAIPDIETEEIAGHRAAVLAHV